MHVNFCETNGACAAARCPRTTALIAAARCPWARKAVPYPRGRGDVPSGMFSLYPWREKDQEND